VFGGSVDSVALSFKTHGHENYFYYYISGLVFLSLLIYGTMRDTKHTSRIG
jgi:MHS family alpha-ketoglutarate permease-like MFS transporter